MFNIDKPRKTELSDQQKKFLTVLFGEANGNAKQAAEIAGYSEETVDANFSGMISAFKFGAPPHGGFAPGIDRIVMLIANEPNIREVILFPMNGKAEDLMMGAPSEISDDQLKELNIKKNKIIK